jgi:hypothetical protein
MCRSDVRQLHSERTPCCSIKRVSHPSARNRQVIGGDITLVCVMTLDPDELGPPTLGLPLIEPVAH